MKHVITATVENKPGVLARIVGLISGRGFNIESLNVAPTMDPTLSRMTMTIPGDDKVLEQVTKQLNKLIDIVKVTDLTRKRFLNRELVLVEVVVPADKRKEIKDIAKAHNATIALALGHSTTFQIVGEQTQIDAFLDLLAPYRVLGITRSGVVAVSKTT